jgi:hypothetical protein
MRTRELGGALVAGAVMVDCGGGGGPARAPPPLVAPLIASGADADQRVRGLADAGCIVESTSGVVEVSVEFGLDGAPHGAQIRGADHPRDDELRCIASFVADHAFTHPLYAETTGSVRWTTRIRAPESVPAFWCDAAPTLRGRATVIRRRNDEVVVTVDEPRDLPPTLRTCLVRQIMRGEPRDAWAVPLSYSVLYQLNPQLAERRSPDGAPKPPSR